MTCSPQQLVQSSACFCASVAQVEALIIGGMYGQWYQKCRDDCTVVSALSLFDLINNPDACILELDAEILDPCTITGNTNLDTITAPNFKRHSGFQFLIADNPKLTTIDFPALFNNAPTAGRMLIRNNAILPSIDFPMFHSAGDFAIDTCASLKTVSLGYLIGVDGYISIGNNPALTSVDLSVLANIVEDFYFENNTVITSLSLPKLTGILGFPSFEGWLDCTGCSSLSSINIPLFIPANSNHLLFDGCALPQSQVDAILVKCANTLAYTSGKVSMLGPNNAAPSAVGVAAAATLTGRGVTVQTN